jgi:hypothetical protein
VDNADPLGLYTLGVCLGGSSAYGIFAGSAGYCLTRTKNTSSDDIGFALTVAGGLGFGAGVGVNLYYEISTCTTLSCLGGWFEYYAMGFKYYVGMGVTIFWGNWNSHSVPTTFGADFGISVGKGGQASSGVSYTFVNKYTCGSNWVCKSKANAARAVWNTLTGPVQWLANDMSRYVGWATSLAKWLIAHGK